MWDTTNVGESNNAIIFEGQNKCRKHIYIICWQFPQNTRFIESPRLKNPTIRVTTSYNGIRAKMQHTLEVYIMGQVHNITQQCAFVHVGPENTHSQDTRTLTNAHSLIKLCHLECHYDQ